MKVLNFIGKLLGSILSFPFALVGGLLYGLVVALCYMFILPVAVIVDIWE